MTDKYEEFKEFAEGITNPCDKNIVKMYIKVFEKHSEEKEKEIEYSKKIAKIVYENVSHPMCTNKGLCVDGKKIYGALKEEGLLK